MKMCFRKILLASSALLLIVGGAPVASSEKGPAQATTAEGEKYNSFQQALVSAYMTNSTLRSKVREHAGIAEAVPKAMSGYRPNISATASSDRTRVEQVTKSATSGGAARASDTASAHVVGLSMSQNIFRSGGTVAATHSADSSVLSAQYDFMNTEQDTLLNAISAYFDVIFRAAAVDFNKSAERYLVERLEAVKAEVEVGEKTITALAESESRLAKAVADRIGAEGDFKTAKATYVRVIGEEPGLLDTPEPVQGLPPSLDALMEMAKQYNPTILRAVHAEKASKSDIHVTRSALLPTVDVQGSVDRTVSRGDSRRQSNNLAAKVTLTVPIYQTGAEWSNLRERYQKAGQSRVELEVARKQVIENATSAWEKWASAKKQVEQFKAQIKFALQSRDSVILEVEVGERPHFDVLQAQSELLEAQVNLARAERDLAVFSYQLLSIVGKLTARGLMLPVASYNVEEYAQKVRHLPFGFGPDNKNF